MFVYPRCSSVRDVRLFVLLTPSDISFIERADEPTMEGLQQIHFVITVPKLVTRPAPGIFALKFCFPFFIAQSGRVRIASISKHRIREQQIGSKTNRLQSSTIVISVNNPPSKDISRESSIYNKLSVVMRGMSPKLYPISAGMPLYLTQALIAEIAIIEHNRYQLNQRFCAFQILSV
jgi:hypothetical protein